MSSPLFLFFSLADDETKVVVFQPLIRGSRKRCCCCCFCGGGGVEGASSSPSFLAPPPPSLDILTSSIEKEAEKRERERRNYWWVGACSLLLLLLSQFLRRFVPRGVGEAHFYARLRSSGKGQKSISIHSDNRGGGGRGSMIFFIYIRQMKIQVCGEVDARSRIGHFFFLESNLLHSSDL